MRHRRRRSTGLGSLLLLGLVAVGFVQRQAVQAILVGLAVREEAQLEALARTLIRLAVYGATLAALAVAGWGIWHLAKWVRSRREKDRLRACGMAEIDAVAASPKLSTYQRGTFLENRLEVAFRDLGYRVQHTGRSGDWGCDLIAERRRDRILIQSKNFHTAVVRVDAVAAINTARCKYGDGRAVVITSGRFTDPALNLARSASVECWGRPRLERLLLDAQRARMKAA